MPGGVTKFCKSWLDVKDCQGHVLNKWLIQQGDCGYCTLCQKTVNCGNQGLQQILQHAASAKHKQKAETRFSAKQGHFEFVRTESSGNSSSSKTKGTISLDACLNDKVTKAEVLWAMKTAHNNYSFASSDDIPQLFQEMMPCPVSENFSMSQTKVSYLIKDGLGPRYLKELCSEIRSADVYYTLQFDETVTTQVKKQCNLLVRYWSENEGRVSVRFLQALFFGHAKGQMVAEKIIETLLKEGINLPLSKLRSVCSDGPNVNKTVWRVMNEKLKETGYTGLLPLIPCNIHVAHNAFRSGLDSIGEDAEDLALDIHRWLHLSPCHTCDYLDVQLEFDMEMDNSLFIRHVQSRWLTLTPALEKIVKKWDVLKEYFLKRAPQLATKQSKAAATTLQNNKRYKSICLKLNSPTMLSELYFIMFWGKRLEKFLRFFQTEGPLIHTLYDELNNTIRGLMQCFIKKDITEKCSKELIAVDVTDVKHHLEVKDMDVGETTRQALSQVPSAKQKSLLLEMKQCMVKTTEYLMKHFPTDVHQLLKDLSYLHPLLKDKSSGINAIKRIAKKFPSVDDSQDSIVTEWKLYQSQDIPREWFVRSETRETTVFHRIDVYWKNVLSVKTLSRGPKYPSLTGVVKSALCLAHGNAEVERSLSINKRMLTSDRTKLSDESINGLRVLKDVVQMHDGSVHKVPVKKEAIEAARHSYAAYRRRLEEEREEKLIAERERTAEEEQLRKSKEKEKLMELQNQNLQDKDSELQKREKDLEEELKAAERLLSEGNSRLSSALKKKDYSDASVAQSLMEVAEGKLTQVTEKLQACREHRKNTDRKKHKLLDDAISYGKKSKH